MFTDVKEKQVVGPRRNAQLDSVPSCGGRRDSGLTAGREHSPRAPEDLAHLQTFCVLEKQRTLKGSVCTNLKTLSIFKSKPLPLKWKL